MNLRKMWKRFWTLDVHNHAGFTLVELIIVIAILAILSSVAVVGYSSYIKKANMQADQTLAAEVANALQLYYYSNSDVAADGYIILNTNGGEATASNDFVKAAMEAAYGKDWDKILTLKYNGWTNDGLLTIVAGYSPEELENIKNSTYMTTATTEGMMQAVTNLLGIATGKILGSGNVATHLSNLGGDLSDTLNGLGLTDEGEQATAISNLLVGHFANALATNSENSDDTNSVSNLITYYASIYAFCESEGDFTLLEAFNDEIADWSYGDIVSDENKDKCADALENGAAADAFEKYVAYVEEDEAQYNIDADALLDMMGAVGCVAGSYTDKDSLTNPELYVSADVIGQVDSYKKAIEAVANGMTLPTTLPDGAVLVVLYADGSTYRTI